MVATSKGDMRSTNLKFGKMIAIFFFQDLGFRKGHGFLVWLDSY